MKAKNPKGAGRKPDPNKKIQYSTRFRPDTVEFLQGVKKAAPWIERLIDKARKLYERNKK